MALPLATSSMKVLFVAYLFDFGLRPDDDPFGRAMQLGGRRLCAMTRVKHNRRLGLGRRIPEKWRRERGARFETLPMGLWSGEMYRGAEYSPEGRRLIPVAIGLEIVSIALAVATFIWFVRAA